LLRKANAKHSSGLTLPRDDGSAAWNEDDALASLDSDGLLRFARRATFTFDATIRIANEAAPSIPSWAPV